MSVADEHMDFQEALRELKLDEQQMKRLVSEGGVRAIRDPQNPGNMRFRTDEIAKMKVQLASGATKDLKEDLVFDESQGLDIADEGMATAQINPGATQVGNSGKTAVPPKEAAKPAPKLSTSRSGAKPATARSTAAPATSSSARRSTGSAAPAATDDGSGVGAGMVASLALSALVCLFAAMVWWDISNNHVSGATKGISDWALKTFTTPK